MSHASQYRCQIAADRDAQEQPYDAHWTPEYRANIKARADQEWNEISERYDALRNPLEKPNA